MNVNATEKQNKRGNIVPWLLAANILALTIFGGRYWYSTVKARQEQQKLMASAASSIVKEGGLNQPEANRLLEISSSLEHGEKISDADLDWCLSELKSQQPSHLGALSRRQDIDMTLDEAIKNLDPPQKEKLFLGLVTQIAGDDPKDEVGIDVCGPARMFGELGDRRAIPVLKAHLKDPRPFVHQTVQKAVNRLEGKASK